MRQSFLAAMTAMTLAALFVPQASHAGGGPKDHKGLLLRLTAGGLYASSEDNEVEVSGFGGDFTFALGGCVSENFAVHGTLFSWSLNDPDVEIKYFGSGELDGNVGMSAYGAGVTYYVMPANVYFSGSVGLGFLSVDIEGIDDETSDGGFAMDLSVAKEWWVGNSWGLGVAGAFGFHTIEDVKGYNVGVRFSATFN